MSGCAFCLISGLILAAGFSQRMGSPKQSVLIGGKPMLEHSIDVFLSSNVDEVVVVVNKDFASSLLTHQPNLKYVVNPNPSLGLSSSLKLGLKSISLGSEAVAIGLGDKPLLLPSTIDTLVAAYEKTGSRIVVPTFDGNRGNPILFHRSLFPSILGLKGDVGAKEMVMQYEGDVLEVEVDDVGILLDVDTPSDVGRVEAAAAARKLAHGRETRK